MLRVLFLFYIISSINSFLFYKQKLFKPYIFLFENTNVNENENANENIKINIKSKSRNKNNKKTSGCDERPFFENITEIMEFKKEYSKNLAYFHLLNLLYDDTVPIFNKIYFIEENIFLNRMFDKKNIVHDYNITSGGLFKDWDFKF